MTTSFLGAGPDTPADDRARRSRRNRDGMGRYILGRVLLLVPILVGVSIVVFATTKLVPGNVVDAMLDPQAPPAAREALVERLGLNQPLVLQYFSWLGHALQGDWGISSASQVPALDLVLDAFGRTLSLAAFAGLLALTIGFVLGGIAASTGSRVLARLLDGLAIAFVSSPAYTLGLILIVFLAVQTPMFPSTAVSSSDDFGEVVHHLFLPAVTAAIVPGGLIARVFRTLLLEVRSADFIEAYRARGTSRRMTILHAMHNCMPGMLVVAGLQIAYLLNGVVFVETIFSWPGIGQLVYQSITKRDLTVIQAGVMTCTLAFVILNLLVDVARAAIDPRVRESK